MTRRPRNAARRIASAAWGLALATIATGAFGAVAVPSPDTLEVQAGTGTERGIVRILCSVPREHHRRLTRGIVIDLGDSTPRHEVVLAPAHGLPADPERVEEDCRISNANGGSVKIARLWLSTGRDTAGAREKRMAHDWAVLLTASPLPGEVGRLHTAVFAPQPLETLVEREATVAVMLSRSTADQTGCALLDRLEPAVFLHSCRSWPGLSGAPILVAVHGAPVVVGINVAHMMRPPNVTGPLFLGVGVAIGEEIEAAIRTAAERARGDSDSEPAARVPRGARKSAVNRRGNRKD